MPIGRQLRFSIFFREEKKKTLIKCTANRLFLSFSTTEKGEDKALLNLFDSGAFLSIFKMIFKCEEFFSFRRNSGMKENENIIREQ